MHEVSLVRSIFRTLEEEFPADKLERLVGISMKVGPLSNVEPTLMHNAFDALITSETKYSDVSLDIEHVPVLIYCSTCDDTSEVDHYRFMCATCGKPSSEVVQGTELLIHQVHFSDN